MDTSPLSVESSVPVPGDTELEEAAGDCYSEEVDSSVIMVVPSNDTKKPPHHERKCSTAFIPNSETMTHEDEAEIGQGRIGTVDINENHCSGHKEGVSCRRKTASVSLGTGALGVSRYEEDISRFNTSNRNGRNLATFYMRHNDTDSDQDISRGQVDTAQPGKVAEIKTVEDSSDDEWTYKQGSASPARMNGTTDGSGSSSETSFHRRHIVIKKKLDFGSGPENKVNNNDVDSEVVLSGKHNSTNKVEAEWKEVTGSPGRRERRNSPETLNRLVIQAEEMVRDDALPDKMVASGRAAREFEPFEFSKIGTISASSQAKNTRIKQWLKWHHQDLADAKPLLQVSLSNFVNVMNQLFYVFLS
jgi:hypothetical protein